MFKFKFTKVNLVDKKFKLGNKCEYLVVETSYFYCSSHRVQPQTLILYGSKGLTNEWKYTANLSRIHKVATVRLK